MKMTKKDDFSAADLSLADLSIKRIREEPARGKPAGGETAKIELMIQTKVFSFAKRSSFKHALNWV